MSDTPKPGPELDRLVAEKVMGWTDVEVTENHPGAGYWAHGTPPEPQCQVESDGQFVVPLYSADISAAWEVLESLRSRGLLVVVSSPTPRGTTWDVRGWNAEADDNRFIAHADTAPHAICLAALRACEP